jgi:hypothetical protein
MSSKYKMTRKNYKKQIAGASTKAPSKNYSIEIPILDINSKIYDKVLHGFPFATVKMPGKDYYSGKLTAERFIKFGNFFNPSVTYYSFNGKNFLLGVSRFNIPKKAFGEQGKTAEDKRTGTTVVNRDPTSNFASWETGWESEYDIPIFFTVDLTNWNPKHQQIHIFPMKYVLNYLTNHNERVRIIEDPRIMRYPYLVNGKQIFIFYGHEKLPLRKSQADKLGKNLDASLNQGARDVFVENSSNPKEVVYPYISWCSAEAIEKILLKHYFNEGIDIDELENATWRPVAINFLNYETEKNWAMVPNFIEKENEYVLDFIASIGILTKSVVVYRMNILNLLEDPVKYGKFQDEQMYAMYIQSLNGKIRLPGKPIQTEGYFHVPTNNKISILKTISTKWLNVLVKFFVHYFILFKNITAELEYGFRIKAIQTEDKGKSIIQFYVPVIEKFNKDAGGAQWHSFKHSLDDINNLKIKFINGISTGGPSCQFLDDETKVVTLNVGHLKLVWNVVYVAYATCIMIEHNDEYFKQLTYFIDNKEYCTMDANEQENFMKFVQFLKTEQNIFQYIFSYIYQLEPFYKNFTSPATESIVGYFRNKPIIHHSLIYTSYIFKMRKDNFQLISVSPQYYFNVPDDCKGPMLQFASTIASNDKDTYYLPYGDNDMLSRVGYVNKNIMNNFLKNEKLLNEEKKDDDYIYYYDLVRQFFSLYIFEDTI